MAVKVCKESFAFFTHGVPRVVRKGDLVDDSDVAYKDHKSQFETLKATRDTSTFVNHYESATANPGEKRAI